MTLTEEEKAARRAARRREQQEQQETWARRQEVIEARYIQQYRCYRDWEAIEDRLRALVPKALAVLEKALEPEADPKQAVTVAAMVLRLAGLQELRRPSKPNRLLIEHEIEPALELDVAEGGPGEAVAGPVR